jgi:DNA polymerase I-like protein with 3'-5' exonuclease and polymerase domains
MLSAYAEGRDLHTLTARSLTGRKEVTKDDRKLAYSTFHSSWARVR